MTETQHETDDPKAELTGCPAARATGLIDRLGRTMHCLQFAEGLNPAQWTTLRYLKRANRYSRTPTALADYLGATKGTVSQTIKCLEDKGLVGRAAHSRDRRAVLLELTSEADVALARDPLKCIELAAASQPHELKKANDFLDRLLGCLTGRAEADNKFGVCGNCRHFGKEGAETAAKGPHQCGLTAEPLSVPDSEKICVNYKGMSAPV